MSCRHLKRRMARLNLRRRRYSLDMAIRAIQEEMMFSGQTLGCRSMKRRLLQKHGIFMGRDDVLCLLRIIDPDGVDIRASHCLTRRMYLNNGPNYLVHVDGYDKLKPFGFAIHGAMCGFSRRILWLKVARTNNDPSVVASYFLKYLEEINSAPRCVRIDAGTENVYIEDIQKSFRWYHNDDMCGEKSVIKGRSMCNQRIERWWRALREMGISFWIHLFKDMEDQGMFSSANNEHIECLRFCLTKIIQQELDQIKMEWNNHYIRAQRRYDDDGGLAGKPEMMFFHPELFGAVDYKFPVEIHDVLEFQRLFPSPSPRGCCEDYATYFDHLLLEGGKTFPNTFEKAMATLKYLVEKL
uniref:Uncharacterized protein LOC111134127 n=1 Tax=Crassostrea virginica TaxID=6565 RepID=A0A8B8EG34_CRAVI|nr:uncharacterized protein LOC111134127 [Crassostrea virginica]